MTNMKKYWQIVRDLRAERESLRQNLNSGLCSDDLAAQFEIRMLQIDEALEPFDERERIEKEAKAK